LSVSVWQGVVTSDDVHRHMADLGRDDAWGAGGVLLTDLSGVSAASRPTPTRLVNAASELTSRLKSRLVEACWAIVTGGMFAEANRFAGYMEEAVGELWVFEDLESAAQWLGHDAGVVGRLVWSVCEELNRGSASGLSR
jgi:hypothetical protein